MFCHFYALQNISGAVHDLIVTSNARVLFMLFYYIFNYISFLAISYKLTPVVSAVIDIGDRILSTSSKRHLIRKELFCVILYFALIILTIINDMIYRSVEIFNPSNVSVEVDSVNHWVSLNASSKSVSFFCKLIIVSMNQVTQGCMIGSAIIYCYLVYVMFIIRKSFVHCIVYKKKNVNELKLIWNEVINLEHKLESNLNIIPFVAISILFVDVTAVVVIFCQPKKNFNQEFLFNSKIQQITHWVYELIIATPVLAMPVIVSWTEQKLIIEIDSSRNHVMATGAEALFIDVKSNVEMKLTGFGFFKLNQELILSFVASVITFSVLLLQLSQS